MPVHRRRSKHNSQVAADKFGRSAATGNRMLGKVSQSVASTAIDTKTLRTTSMGEAAVWRERLLTALKVAWGLIDLNMMSERPLIARRRRHFPLVRKLMLPLAAKTAVAHQRDSGRRVATVALRYIGHRGTSRRRGTRLQPHQPPSLILRVHVEAAVWYGLNRAGVSRRRVASAITGGTSRRPVQSKRGSLTWSRAVRLVPCSWKTLPDALSRRLLQV